MCVEVRSIPYICNMPHDNYLFKEIVEAPTTYKFTYAIKVILNNPSKRRIELS